MTERRGWDTCRLRSESSVWAEVGQWGVEVSLHTPAVSTHTLGAYQ